MYIAKTNYLFHCNIKIKIPEKFGEVLLDESFDFLRSIDLKYNSYQQDSFFSRINENAGKWVNIDDDCVYMIKHLLTISECTNGAYDISCMPLLKLWGFYRTNNQDIPSEQEIDNTLQKVNYRNIQLDENRVRISEQQEIITGSFIKSFAVDKVIHFLKSKGVSDAIINAGGSTIYGINNNIHESWKINIPNTNPMETTSHQITIRNQCFCLSAQANNNITIQGKRYGHILNSATGHPSPTLQVGVWCDSAFLCDALSTAIYSVEKSQIEETISKLQSKFDFRYYRIDN